MVEIRVNPFGKAEDIFNYEAVKLCNDKVGVKLGEIWGTPWNSYVVSDDDYEVIKDIVENAIADEAKSNKVSVLLVCAGIFVVGSIALWAINKKAKL